MLKSTKFRHVVDVGFLVIISCVLYPILLTSAFSASVDLSQTYRSIAERSNKLSQWPDSQKFRQDCLVYNQQSQSYQLPEFRDGHGTLGVFGFLHENDAARTILNRCDEVFNQFVSEIDLKVLSGNPEQQATFARWVLQSPPISHHISVAILQEHPMFLQGRKDLDKWEPITDPTIQKLATEYARAHSDLLLEVPTLEIDSLLWTPDGALIAGFVDKSSHQSFKKLRASSRAVARDVIGDALTTRPKNLIHATVGRIVGLPPNATESQYQTLAELARKYNQHILPQTVEHIRSANQRGGTFPFQELTLARNKIWMLKEYQVYAKWSLLQGPPEK